ncbi:hypothetical protein Q5752_000658 [Cryptotrichosporon argae]
MRFADIAVNLGDPMFQGVYHCRPKHTADLPAVLQRAKDTGVDRILITGTSLAESKTALELAKQHGLHSTAGCHPTSTSEIDVDADGVEAYFAKLEALVKENAGVERRIISIGEIGLDYDRLHFAPKETQLKHLPRLLLLSKTFGLPLFLHSRHPDAHIDLVAALRSVGWDSTWPGGVVHSFTGSAEEMRQLVDMGLYIGINGCSLKTPENLDVIKIIPLDRLLLETDAPWCGPTSTHASFAHIHKGLNVVDKVKPEKFVEGKGVKGRNEPAEVSVIAHIVASVRGVKVEDLASAVWDNTTRLFYPSA